MLSLQNITACFSLLLHRYFPILNISISAALNIIVSPILSDKCCIEGVYNFTEVLQEFVPGIIPN
jgi:hypothetical protein